MTIAPKSTSSLAFSSIVNEERGSQILKALSAIAELERRARGRRCHAITPLLYS